MGESSAAVAPLVVTALLDPATQQRFDDERRRLFPTGRTQVGAHVTLFHAVPGEHVEQVHHDLQAQRRAGPFEVRVTGVRNLGRGVAYVLAAPELVRLHERLAKLWWPWLTRQDQQGFRPHVTVQNKVDASTARQTAARLAADLAPVSATCVGVGLWRYLGGPWAPEATVRFDGGTGEADGG